MGLGGRSEMGLRQYSYVTVRAEGKREDPTLCGEFTLRRTWKENDKAHLDPPPPYFILCEALNHTAPDEKEAFR